jgi:uncharacterized protein YndB with AHSA1/START domain
MNREDTVGNRRGSAVLTLTSDTDYAITRVFDAAADLIFKAFTTPELVKRWWTDPADEWITCEIDLRAGGSWRWVFRHGDFEVGFHGDYRTIEPPNQLVYTEMFEMPDTPLPDRDAYPVCTMTLDEADRVTTMTLRVHHTTQEERDMVLASGMEEGMQASYDRLEDVIRNDS